MIASPLAINHDKESVEIMLKKKIVAIGMISAALLTSAVGCSNEEEKAKEEANSTELKKEIQDLKLENSELKTENEKLKKKVEILQKSK
ncbi:hypothetical protein [Metabacillus malikii]|uniref:Cell division protein FtsB n=1 Tax=Metabacillus malikii TaxID=1504265 RepID=A0ABT9ZHP9_9BACI|nr:hypothetical protein [Metabacillus malikii]MDQ0231424.1 cell division protein FtsB [Metabacillus malikii]